MSGKFFGGKKHYFSWLVTLVLLTFAVAIVSIGAVIFFSHWLQNRAVTLCVFVFFLLIGAIALVRFGEWKKSHYSFPMHHFRERYADLLQNVFEKDRKAERSLCRALNMMYAREYEKTIERLTLLENRCKNKDSYFVVYILQAKSYKELWRFGEAIVYYDKALMLKTDTSAVLEKAICLLSLDDIDGAIACYRGLSPSEMHRCDVYLTLSELYYKKGDYENALSYAKMELEWDEDHVRAYIDAAEACAMLEDREGFWAFLAEAPETDDEWLIDKIENLKKKYVHFL